MSAPLPSSDPPGNESNAQQSALLSARQRLRLQRELDERRRFGLAPLAVDVEAQVEISPNVPSALAQAPWFYEVQGPTLTHQRLEPSDATSTTELKDVVDKVTVLGAAKKFSAGACHNCGSRTHKTKECFQAKKKVGAKYSQAALTGVDIRLEKAEKTYAQKRDRFVGDVGVDLLRGVEQEVPPPPKEGEEEERSTKHPRLDIFQPTTAQHGGTDIKPVPKYLRHLDAMERGDLYFDPKTGSLRGDYLAVEEGHESAKTGVVMGSSSGDLARYKTGGYHLYAEQQYRFLTGASKSFVDFELDKAIGVVQAAVAARGGGEVVEEEARERPVAGASSLAGHPATAMEATVSKEALEAAAAALGVHIALPAEAPSHHAEAVVQAVFGKTTDSKKEPKEEEGSSSS